jgi:hypothetical protein
VKSLADLHPRWIGQLRPESGEGISLDCPVCGPHHQLAAYFENPVDGIAPAPWGDKWKRTGESFHDLTVEPSINYPCFHGWIENGNVIDISESPAAVVMIVNGKQELVALSPLQFERLKNTGTL